VAALLLPEPPGDTGLPPDFRNLAKSASRELSPQTLLAIRTARWLQSCAIEMRKELRPRTIFTKSVGLSQHPETVADAVRQSLTIDLAEQTQWASAHAAYGRWREAIEDQGVLVFQLPFPREESQGFSLYDPACPVIVANESDSIKARIFTLFHEYGHLLLQRPGICLPTRTTDVRSTEVEPFCNRFAAAVLIPSAEVRSWRTARDARDVSDEELIELARQYHVSKYVVLISLRTRGRLSEQSFSRLYRRWLSQDASRGPSPRRATAGGPSAVQKCRRQRGRGFISLVVESAQRGVITEHDAVTYLGVKLGDLNKLEQ
jgi:Zn-dependent peptidase ImmA (M78 family)